jgi:uncharacterized protein (DUF1778 family)
MLHGQGDIMAAAKTLSGTRQANINIRVSAEALDMIDRAAAQLGKTRSEFMLDAARREAESALLDRRLFQAGAAAFKAFLRRLDEPADPASLKRLAKTLKAKAPWER